MNVTYNVLSKVYSPRYAVTKRLISTNRSFRRNYIMAELDRGTSALKSISENGSTTSEASYALHGHDKTVGLGRVSSGK